MDLPEIITAAQSSIHQCSQSSFEGCILFQYGPGVISASGTQSVHLVGEKAEDKGVFSTGFFNDFDVGSIHGAQCNRAIHHEFHVSGA